MSALAGEAPVAEPAPSSPSADGWCATLPRPTGLVVQKPTLPLTRPYFYVRRDGGRCVAASSDPATLLSKLEAAGYPILVPRPWEADWPAGVKKPEGLGRRRTGDGVADIWVVRRGVERKAVAMATDPRVLLDRLASWERTGLTVHRRLGAHEWPLRKSLRRKTVAVVAEPEPTPTPTVVERECPPEPMTAPPSLPVDRPEPVDGCRLDAADRARIYSLGAETHFSRSSEPKIGIEQLGARLGCTPSQIRDVPLPKHGRLYKWSEVRRALRQLAAKGQAPLWWLRHDD